MDNKNIILIVIAILVIALAAVGAYIVINGNSSNQNAPISTNITTKTADTNNNSSDVIMIDDEGNVTNDTKVVGDNSPRNESATNNTTHRVYNPLTDSYVTVVGEGYDVEVDRWYTYDTDGVRYYNTRIK